METGEEFENIAAQLLFEGYWKFENGVYTYTIKLLLDNTNKTENAEKP